MAKLTAAARAKIPTKSFGLQSKAKTVAGKKASGSYPINDKAHAAAAKSRAKQQLDKGNLSRADFATITAKANKKLGKPKVKKLGQP